MSSLTQLWCCEIAVIEFHDDITYFVLVIACLCGNFDKKKIDNYISK